MNWIKQWLRRWLEVPTHPYSPSAQVLAMAAECTEAAEATRATLDKALRYENFTLIRAMADFEAAKMQLADMHDKLDAVIGALGFVVVANPGQGPAVIVEMEHRVRRARRVLEARGAVTELNHLVAAGRAASLAMDAIAQRMKAMRDTAPKPLQQ